MTAREFAHRNGPLKDVDPRSDEAIDVCDDHGRDTIGAHCNRCDDETETIEAAWAEMIEAAAQKVADVIEETLATGDGLFIAAVEFLRANLIGNDYMDRAADVLEEAGQS